MRFLKQCIIHPVLKKTKFDNEDDNDGDIDNAKRFKNTIIETAKALLLQHLQHDVFIDLFSFCFYHCKESYSLKAILLECNGTH